MNCDGSGWIYLDVGTQAHAERCEGCPRCLEVRGSQVLLRIIGRTEDVVEFACGHRVAYMPGTTPERPYCFECAPLAELSV